jgi:hypothetical protein
MRKSIYTGLLCFFTLLLNAQSSNEIGKIALSIVIPDNIEGLNSSNLSKLETKIIQLVTQSGLASNGYSSNFIIYPKLAIYDDKFVEGGTEDIFMLNCELTLILKQVDNNIIYSTSVTKLKGSGVDKQIAFNNAISKINSNSKEFVTFIETGKQKIIDYCYKYAIPLPDFSKYDEVKDTCEKINNTCHRCKKPNKNGTICICEIKPCYN